MTSAEAMAVDAASPPAQKGSSSSRFRLQPVAELVGHDGRCWGIDWSPEGDTLASCGADRTVRTWHQLRSSSNSSSRSAGGGKGGRWAPDAVLEESQARAVRAVAWAPPPAAAGAAAGAAAASGGKGERRRSGLRRRRRRLAAASFDASVAVWEEERPAAPPPGGEIGDDDDGGGGGAGGGGGGDDEPTLWSQVALLQGHESEVKGVAWSPLPGATEAGEGAGGSSEAEDEEGAEGGDGGGENPPPPPSSSRPPPPPPLPADGEGCILATCGRDRSVWLWESVPASPPVSASSGCEFECVDVKQGHSGDVKGLAWHPSGSVLVSASYDGTVRLWVPEGGASEGGAGGGGGGGGAGGAGGGGNATAVGDEWLCGQEVKGAHGGETVWSFAFEPRRTGRKKSLGSEFGAVRAASCGGDGRVSVWRCPLPLAGEQPAATEALRWQPGAVARSAAPPALGGRVRPAYSVDWSPCGRWIACGGGDDFVRVFRAPPREGEDEEGGEDEGGEGGEEEKKGAPATGEVLLELAAEARPLPPCEVNCVKWRRGRKRKDHPMLAAACDDGVVRLWRLEEGGE